MNVSGLQGFRVTGLLCYLVTGLFRGMVGSPQVKNTCGRMQGALPLNYKP